MGQLAVSVVGAGAGFVLSGFNPAGAAIGWSLGSAVGSILFAPDAPNQTGPRLDNLTVQASTQGQPIARVFGKNRIAGNVFWSTDIEEHEHEKDIGGGKGGGGGGTQTTFTYTANFAIGLCEGPIIAVLRIWADGKLIFDEQDADNVDALTLSRDLADGIRVYYGDESQLPDPLIQGVEGIENTPAYRGTAYLVFDDFELADFGNRIPNITAEVITSGTPSFRGPVVSDVPTFESVRELWIEADDGIIDWFVFVGPTESLNGNTNTSWERQRHKMDGELVERMPLTFTYPWPTIIFNSGVTELGMVGPVRFLPGVYVGRIREVNNPLGFAAPYAWFVNGVGQPSPLQDEDGVIFGQESVASVQFRALDGPAINVYYNENVYSIFGNWQDTAAVLCRFPAPSGVPFHKAEAEYTAALNFADVFVNSQGVWLLRFNSDGANSVCFIDHLDLEDLELIQTYSVEAGPNLADWAGLVVRGDKAIVGGGTNEQFYVLSLNDDGTTTTLDSGIADGGLETLLPAVIGTQDNPVGLLVQKQYIFFGLYADEPVTLASIVRALCNECGLTEYTDFDVSTLENDLVAGYAISKPGSVREGILPLQQGYFFDVIESDFILKFPKRGGDPIATIGEDDLAAHVYGETRPQELRRKRKQDLELPRRVHIQYTDPDRDYQAGEQWAGRLQTRSVAVEIVTVPVVFTPDEARPIADALLYDAWVSRDEYEFNLGPQYVYLDAADTIKITHQNATHYVRLTNTDFQLPGLLRAQGVSVRAPAFTQETLSPGSLHNTYESNAPGSNSPVEQPMEEGLEGPSLVVLIDSTMLRDADNNAGIYHAGRGYAAGWRGYGLFKSLDGGSSFTQIDTNFSAATIGLTTDALGSPSSGFTVIDEGSSLNIRIDGTLSSTTDALFLARQQMALVGAHGRWELIAFRDATLELDGTYTISYMMRGLRGTDHNMANHVAGDYFILLSELTMDRVSVGISEIDMERVYKGVSAGRTLQETEAQDFTFRIESLRPYSPVHVSGKRDTSGNLIITWQRRTRVGQSNWDISAIAPIAEVTESYSIDILQGSTVKRTITASSKTATYTAAQQTTDFGSLQSSVTGNLYQISGDVGRGTARSFIF